MGCPVSIVIRSPGDPLPPHPGGDGTQGPQGPQGPQGAGDGGGGGSQGFQGPQGPQGPQSVGSGTQGPQGVTGSGTQGTQGSSGSGTQGAQGVVGSGTQGTQGFQGSSGSGTQGSQGVAGSGTQGTQGVVGSGTQGSQGVAGSGTQGTQGFQGSSGSGTQGTQGITGSGIQGATGSSGSQGTQGTQGVTGAGTQGTTGSSGSQGSQGNQGGSSALAIGSAITGSQARCVLFANGSQALAQDTVNFVYDSSTHRLGIGTQSPAAAIDVGIGRLTGGTNSALQRNFLDLSSGLSSADFLFSSGGTFRAANTSVAGSNDIFFQALPSTTTGFGYLEAWNAAGLILGTGGTGTASPIQFKTNRTLRGQLTGAGSFVFTTTTALTTTATDGFTYLPKCAGIPTGTPTTVAGIPFVYDNTDNMLYCYNGSWSTVGSHSAIGSPVISGTSKSVLYVDASSNLAQSSTGLAFDSSTNSLGIGTQGPQAGVHITVNSSTAKGLIVKAASGQSANIVEILNNSGVAIDCLGPQGYLGVGVSSAPISPIDIRGSSSGDPVMSIRPASTPTANIFQALDSTGAIIYEKIGPDGRSYSSSPASAPTDANLSNSQITFYTDESGNNLKVRVKYSNGTLKTGTIALV